MNFLARYIVCQRSRLFIAMMVALSLSTPKVLASDQAITDLSGMDENSGVILLQESWEFYWQNILQPHDPLPQATAILDVGRHWNDIEIEAGVTAGSFGYATYRKVLRGVKPHPDGYEIYLRQAGNAFTLIVFPTHSPHEQQIVHSGIVDPSGSKGGRKGGLIAINPSELTDYTILVHVGNSRIYKGGLYFAPQLSFGKKISHDILVEGIINLISIGILLGIIIYSFMMWVRRKEDKAALILSIAALSMLLRIVALSPFIIDLTPDSLYALIVRIDYATLNLGCSSFLAFLIASFATEKKSLFIKFLILVHLFFLALSLFAPLITFTSLLPAYQILIVTAAVAFLAVVVKAIIRKQSGAILVFWGCLVVSIAAVADVIVTITSMQIMALTPLAATLFLIFQSQLVALRAAEAYTRADSSFKRSEQLASELQKLSKNLKLEVESQTEKLKLQRDKLIGQKKDLVIVHEQLKIHDQQKTRFFQNISHELRTPLTLIMASLKNLLQRAPSDQDADIAERNSRRLLRLVNQLLEFQKITQTEQKFALRQIYIGAFLQTCANYILKACESKGIKLVLEGLTQENLSILCQVDALEKVVFNYLSNALKYTPRGGSIILGMQAENLRLRIYVRDNGPGIAPDEQCRLFKLFSQLDDSDRRAHEGTGLGLALVRELVEKMDGKVGVESAIAQGACFWAEFPLLDESKVLDVMLIDDDLEVRNNFELKLREKTAITRFRSFASAEDALSILNEYRVRCILSDAVLPGMDGPSFLEEAARLQPNAHRILITSRKESHHLVQKAINVAKIERVLYKPLTDEIFSIIETLVDDRCQNFEKPVLDLLIIDDDPNVLSHLMAKIADSTLIDDFKVASDIATAKNLIQNNTFKVVISDANLGGGEFGGDILEYLLQVSPDTCRMMLTAERSTDVLGEAINRGKIQHIFYKPVDIELLLPTLNAAIESSSLRSIDPEALDPKIKDWHLADIEDKFSSVENDLDEYTEDNNISLGTVIICDDIYDMRQLMAACLRKIGFRTIGAADGLKGLAKIREIKPDLIVTDWMMPRMTGPDLIRVLHEDEMLSSIPCILLTAKSDEESKMIGAKVGATAYLSKPFDELELQTLAKNLIELKKSEKKIAELNRYLTEKVLCRFLPPQLVKQVISGELAIDEQPKTMPVTILFSDICNFTELSVELGPKKISEVLNIFLETMSRIIFDHHGTIDKFIGDAIMVIFGAPEERSAEVQVSLATQCAGKMQKALQELNNTWKENGLENLQMRIGIHHGPAVVGQFGSELRSEYTAIGPVVNYAARVQALAEPNSVFISSEVRDYLASGWLMVGRFELKGIGQQLLYKLELKPVEGDPEAA